MRKLSLKFKTADAATSTITVDNARDGLAEADVRPVMDRIIAQNVFNSKSGDFTQIKSAKVTTTTEEILI